MTRTTGPEQHAMCDSLEHLIKSGLARSLAAAGDRPVHLPRYRTQARSRRGIRMAVASMASCLGGSAALSLKVGVALAAAAVVGGGVTGAALVQRSSVPTVPARVEQPAPVACPAGEAPAPSGACVEQARQGVAGVPGPGSAPAAPAPTAAGAASGGAGGGASGGGQGAGGEPASPPGAAAPPVPAQPVPAVLTLPGVVVVPLPSLPASLPLLGPLPSVPIPTLPSTIQVPIPSLPPR